MSAGVLVSRTQTLVFSAWSGWSCSWPELDSQDSPGITYWQRGWGIQIVQQVQDVQGGQLDWCFPCKFYLQQSMSFPPNICKENWSIIYWLNFIPLKLFSHFRIMEERGRSSLTRAGRWWIVSMAGSTTPRSSGTRWSRSWTWCVTTPGGLQHPQLSSMLAVSSVTFSLVRLLTGEKMKIISIFQSENIWRYGRRFAFFMTLFMAVSLSVATAFSPNYWIYTIIRCRSNWSQNVFQVIIRLYFQNS